jgi:predicted metal-dependent enzyme (double-stranded beta helix superfamily)
MYEIHEIRKASKRSLGKPHVVKIVFIPAILAIGIITGANLASPAQAQQQQPQHGNFNAKLAGTNEVHAAGGNLSTVSHTGNNTSGGAVKSFLNQTGRALANAPGETNEFFSGRSESGGNENDTIGK